MWARLGGTLHGGQGPEITWQVNGKPSELGSEKSPNNTFQTPIKDVAKRGNKIVTVALNL